MLARNSHRQALHVIQGLKVCKEFMYNERTFLYAGDEGTRVAPCRFNFVSSSAPEIY